MRIDRDGFLWGFIRGCEIALIALGILAIIGGALA